MSPKVSIITPCYNGEHKVSKFLDSLLNQTYNNIELIIINDGSCDKSEEVIYSYKERLVSKGIDFIYLYQSNQGQASAINSGLKHFTGKYLMWPDSDDVFMKKSIEQMVIFMENHLNFDLVHCNAYFVNEVDNTIIEKKWNRVFSDNTFENFIDVLLWQNVTASGAWMLRSEAFLQVRQNRSIEIMRQGQNWQMLLPMVYNYKIGKVNDFLFKIILYKDSHSRRRKTYSQIKERIIGLNEGRINILQNMKMREQHKSYCLQVVNDDMIKNLYALACSNNNSTDAKFYYKKLGQKRWRDKIKLLLVRLHLYGLIRKLDFSKNFKKIFLIKT